MDKKLDKPNHIRLDVYELKNYKPVLHYRINVNDKIILSVDNKDIQPIGAIKCVDEKIKECLEITPLTPTENLDYGRQLTHKFQIKKLGWENMFLNLTDKDLIKLGFKEKPKTSLQKLIDFSIVGVWIWLERIAVVLTIVLAMIAFRQCSIDLTPKKLEQKQEMQSNQTTSNINSNDTKYSRIHLCLPPKNTKPANLNSDRRVSFFHQKKTTN